jgi:glycosyltransferase involved in cell wall biosynthesis
MMAQPIRRHKFLEDLAHRDDRICIIRQEALGLVAALNCGITRARAPFLARLDADDRSVPERLEHQVNYLQAHPEVGLVGSWVQKLDEQDRPLGQLKPETRPKELVSILMRTNPFVHSAVMFRSAIARRLGGYRSAFRAAEDYDLWLRMADVTRIATLPEFLIEYRWHSANVTKRYAVRQAFSVRLAQQSAEARRKIGSDPADGLESPPDWHSSQSNGTFYTDIAAVYRLLEVADETAKINADDIDLSPLLEHFSKFNHAERKLAALALTARIKRSNWASSVGACILLVRLLVRRPGTALILLQSVYRKS